MAEHYIIDGKEHVYESADEKHHIKKNITLNGTYKAESEPGDVTGYSEVNVDCGGSATLITKNITENGTYNASSDEADGYSSVSVEVPSVQPTLITKNITENGTYNASSDQADGYSSVTVDVPSKAQINQFGTAASSVPSNLKNIVTHAEEVIS